jgi:hypothetical protein
MSMGIKVSVWLMNKMTPFALNLYRRPCHTNPDAKKDETRWVLSGTSGLDADGQMNSGRRCTSAGAHCNVIAYIDVGAAVGQLHRAWVVRMDCQLG